MNGEDVEEKWDIPKHIAPFWDPSDIESVPAGGARLLPERWNQGGYDAVLLLPQVAANQFELRFLQVTRAQSGRHGLKLKYLQRLLQHLQNLGVTVVTISVTFVVPTALQKSYKAGIVVGKLDGWSKSELLVVGVDLPQV
jgi:hypothetical protein